MKRTDATRVRPIRESLPSGTLRILSVGAWLALTVLFTFGGVVLVGTVVTALGRGRGVLSAVIAIVGGAGAYGVSPTLARLVISSALERVGGASGREHGAAPTGRRFRASETSEQVRCRTRCCS